MTVESTRCIAIIGAGFCGTLTAVHLLRHAHATPLRILLIDRSEHGRGVAYHAHQTPFLLNVPAGRMSAFAAAPLDFLHFAQRATPEASTEDFLPRALYGDYLEATLAAAEADAPAHITLTRIRGEVISLDLWRPEHAFMIGFADGREVRAAEVVLALGNPAPAPLRGSAVLESSDRVIQDPWRGKLDTWHGETVLVVGTGLTMADIIAPLHATSGPLRVHALSRHGLLAPSQTAFGPPGPALDRQPLLQASQSIRKLFHAVRQLCKEAETCGEDWREVITFVRLLAPRLWSRLPTIERQRFLRHARSYWDVHRHRLPPQTRQSLDALGAKGKLQVHAGEILRIEPDGEHLRVSWRPRGSDAAEQLLVDRVINCTGPDYRIKHSTDPLVRHLYANGLIQADALGTGLKMLAPGAVINAFGHATPNLHYIGPMLRAEHWEATAVQELRQHAEALAQSLLRPAAQPTLQQATL